MSEIEDIADTEIVKLLQQVNLGELNIVKLHVHVDEQRDMSE